MPRTIQSWVTGLWVISSWSFVTGCNINTVKASPPLTNETSKVTAHLTTSNAQPRWTPVENVVLAKSTVPGYSGQQLELMDVKGRYADNPIVGPLQGKNWTGRFQLRLLGATGNVVSTLNLPSQQFTLFMSKFQFHFC